MPDTETLDRVLDIITRVPHLHDQRFIVASVADPAAARAELEQAPDIRAIVAPQELRTWPTHGCGSSYCVGGWVLILKGCTQDNWNFYPPGVEPDAEGLGALADPLGAARAFLDVDLDVVLDGERLGPDLFHARTTLPQVRAWVAYYKGEISAVDLKILLELYPEGDEGSFLEASSD